jgi:AcrR family transcriptional regulator
MLKSALMKNHSGLHKPSSKGTRSKEAILATAERLFKEIGYEATTLRMIARNADMNIATVMYHFENKERLFEEVMRTQDRSELAIVTAWYASLTASTVADIDRLKDALVSLAISLIDRVISDPTKFRLDVYTSLQAPSGGRNLKREASGKTAIRAAPEKEYVRVVLEKALAAGTLRCDAGDIEDYLSGYSYLSRGFALDHLQEIEMCPASSGEVTRRFRKMIERYTKNMLPMGDSS